MAAGCRVHEKYMAGTERSSEGISQVHERSRAGAFMGAAKTANSLPRGAAMPDRHAPAAPARDCPDAPETAGPDGYGLGPLDSADAAFRALVTAPRSRIRRPDIARA